MRQQVKIPAQPKKILHMKISAQLKVRLEKAAKADGRNLSNLVTKILTDFVEAH